MFTIKSVKRTDMRIIWQRVCVRVSVLRLCIKEEVAQNIHNKF